LSRLFFSGCVVQIHITLLGLLKFAEINKIRQKEPRQMPILKKINVKINFKLRMKVKRDSDLQIRTSDIFINRLLQSCVAFSLMQERNINNLGVIHVMPKIKINKIFSLRFGCCKLLQNKQNVW
jgi:hypothetical protein